VQGAQECPVTSRRKTTKDREYTYLGEKCCAVDMDFEGTAVQPDFGAEGPI